MSYPKPLSEKSIEKMYIQAELNDEKRAYLHKLFQACANLYGSLQVWDVWELYQNAAGPKPKLRRKDITAFSGIVRREDVPYYVYEIDEIYSEEKRKDLERFIISKDLIRTGYGKFMFLYELHAEQSMRPFYYAEDILKFASAEPTKEEQELLVFLNKLKVTYEKCVPLYGEACPNENTGKCLSEFSYVNISDRRMADYYADKPKTVAAILEESEGTEAEKILRNFKRWQNSGRINPAKVIEWTCDELSEVGVRLTDKQLKKLIDLSMAFHNNSRLWCLNGWTPEELMRSEFADMQEGDPTIAFGEGIKKMLEEGTPDE